MAEISDVLVIGGGIIGLAIAREAARASLSVRLLEKGQPGREASGAAAGMLAAQLETKGPGPLVALGLESRDLWSDFGPAIAAESGVDPGLRTEGALVLARDGAEAEHLERQYAFQRNAGLEVTRLGMREIARLEPALAASAYQLALHFPRDVSYDTVMVLRALHLAALRAGARVTTGAPVRQLTLRSGRIVGVEAGDECLQAKAVVVAAGAWSGDLTAEGLPPFPAQPVRGQIVCLDPAEAPFRHTLATERCYLVPRRDGRILVGSTMERVGFDARVTAGAIASLISAAVDLVPALREAPLHSTWAGLRPSTADGLPAIGAGGFPGLYYACGHLRSGILLAPITAKIIVRLLRGEAPGVDLSRFDPRRFAAAGSVDSRPPAPTFPAGPSSPAARGSRP